MKATTAPPPAISRFGARRGRVVAAIAGLAAIGCAIVLGQFTGAGSPASEQPRLGQAESPARPDRATLYHRGVDAGATGSPGANQTERMRRAAERFHHR